MRVAVLGSADSWYWRDLSRAAEGLCRLELVSFRELSSDLSEVGEQIDSGFSRLREYDAVLVRTMPPGTLEQVVFRMDALARLQESGIIVMNSPKSMEVAIDKYLASARLHGAGLLIPRTIVCQTAEQGMEAFERLGGRAVLKPLFGSEGRGITLLEDDQLALRACKMLEQLGAVLYLQEFIQHPGYDYRLLVIGDRVLSMQRRNPLDWRTNISRGAIAEACEVPPEWIAMARQAAQAVGAEIAGVDLLPGMDGKMFVLEVNAVPGWKGIAKALQLDVARLVLEHLFQTVRSAREVNIPVSL